MTDMFSNNKKVMKYFSKAQKRARLRHKNVADEAWPEYITTVRSRVRRVMIQRKSSETASKVSSSVANYYQDVTAQNVAHSQVSKSKRALPSNIGAKEIVVWGGWGVVMAGFLGSLLFNAPLPLGGLIFAALPGESRTGTITLQQDAELYEPGDEVRLTVGVMDIKTKDINGASFHVEYDPQALSFVAAEPVSGGLLKQVEPVDTNEVIGETYVTIAEQANTESSSLVELVFKANTYIGTTQVALRDDFYLYKTSATLAFPEERQTASVVMQPQPLPTQTVAVSTKKDAVNVDGVLGDWRDVIVYDLTVFEPSGTVVDERHLLEGSLQSINDAGGVLELATDSENLYIAFFGVDDEIIAQDVLRLKLGDQLVELDLERVINADYTSEGLSARGARTDQGFNLEIALSRDVFGVAGVGAQDFNFEIEDQDSQNAARLMLSYPNNSSLGF